MNEREITRNAKIEDMRARHAGAGVFARGQRVILEPTRGHPIPALVVNVIEHPLYGHMLDVLAGGKIQRVMAERVSRPRTG